MWKKNRDRLIAEGDDILSLLNQMGMNQAGITKADIRKTFGMKPGKEEIHGDEDETTETDEPPGDTDKPLPINENGKDLDDLSDDIEGDEQQQEALGDEEV